MSARAALAAAVVAGGAYLYWQQRQEDADAKAAKKARKQARKEQRRQERLAAYMAAQRDQGDDMKLNFAPLIGWGIDALSGVFGRNRDNVGTPPGASTPDTGSGPVFDLGSWFGESTSAPRKAAPAAGSDIGPANVDFGDYERRYGLPAGYLRRTAQIESGLNPRAKNPRSSAGGLFQFIDSTARQYGLSNRYEPQQATDAASRLARDNRNYLRRKLGREPSAAELYLAHQQGAGGAYRLLRDPSARAADVVGMDAVRLNGGSADMTAGEFAGLWTGKFNRGYG